MLRNFVSIYLFSAVLLTSFFCTYFLSRSKARHVRIFSLFAFSLSIYILGYVLEINSYDLSQMAFWNQVQYFAIPFISSLMLLFTILLTSKDYQIKVINFISLFAIPVLSFFMRLTNSLHNMYYTKVDVIEISGTRLLFLEKGPWYYIQQIHSLVAILISIALLISKIRSKSSSENKQFRILIVASTLPFLGIVLIIIDFLNSSLDYVTILLPGSILLMTFAILKYDFLEIKTKAREASFENSPDALILLDTNYRIMDFNKTAVCIFPSLENVRGTCRIEEITENDISLIKIFKNQLPDEFILSKGTSEVHYEITSSTIHNSHDKPAGYLKTLRDITENNRIKNQMKQLATIDSLSGIFNRNHFFELVETEMLKASKSGDNIVFMMMDIDNFKLINDRWGHGAGDMVIKEFGNLLKISFSNGITGRVGGEEFGVILSGYDIDAAKVIAEDFREKVQYLKILYESSVISTTVSIGLSFSKLPDKSIENLLKEADKCMYLAKYNGRNRVEACYENLS